MRLSPTRWGPRARSAVPLVWALGAVGVSCGVLVACGGDSDIPPVRVDLIDDAVDAVEDEFGGANGDVAFYEVNATPDLVNVFVATSLDDGSTAAVAYVFEPGGGLDDPAEPQAASGPTFTSDQIDFDPATVLDRAIEELPTSVLRVFAVNGEAGPDGPAAAVGYRAVFDSVSGGSLSVMVAGDGTIIGADAQ